MRSPRRTDWAPPGRFLWPERSRPTRSSSADTRSCALDRALGQDLRDLKFLELDVDAAGDFQGQELLPHLGHLAENAAGGRYFIAHGDFGQHFTLFFGTLVLRPDEQEIEHDQEQDGQQQGAQHALPAARTGGLRLLCIYEEIHSVTLVFCSRRHDTRRRSIQERCANLTRASRRLQGVKL